MAAFTPTYVSDREKAQDREQSSTTLSKALTRNNAINEGRHFVRDVTVMTADQNAGRQLRSS